MNLEAAIIKYRWPVLVLCAAAALFMGWQFRDLHIESDVQTLLPETMPSRLNTKRIEALFGSAEALIYIFETDDVLNPQTLRRIGRITRALEKEPKVKRVLSLSNAKSIKGEDGAMLVEPAVERIPEDPEEKEALRRELRNNEMVSGMVLSEDFKATAIIVSFTSKDVYQAMVDRTAAIVAGVPGRESVSSGGLPMLQSQITKDITRDMLVLIPSALLIMLLVLYGYFRTSRSVALPFLVVLLSMVFGLGVLPLLGWKVTLLTSLLPIMVVAYANNYAIYLMSGYRDLHLHGGYRDPVAISGRLLRDLSAPIFVSGITTMFGILGLLTHVMVPARQVSVAASLAIGFAVFASLAGIPAILSLLPLPKPAGREKRARVQGWLDLAMERVGRLVLRHARWILWTGALVAVLGLGAALMVKVDANNEKLFSSRHPFRVCTEMINRHFGGSQNISLVFTGDIKDPALLRSMAAVKAELQPLHGVGQILSIADVIQTMSRALYDRHEAGYDQIPETRAAVAQFLELYGMSGDAEDFEQLVDFNYEQAQMMIRVNDGSTSVTKALMRRIARIAKAEPHITLVGGYSAVFSELADALIQGQITSILLALVIVSLTVIILFRSAAAGLLSALPLILALILGFGVMGLLGLPLDMATAVISSIVIGTGVDFSVQFLWRYRSQRRSGDDPEAAVANTLTGIGKAIAFNTFCVVAGFAALLLSSMPPLRHLALLFGVLTVTCMLGNLLLVPSICLLWRPKFLEPKTLPHENQTEEEHDEQNNGMGTGRRPAGVLGRGTDRLR